MTAGTAPGEEVRDLRRRLVASSNGGVELDRAELVRRLSPRVEGDDPREVARYAQRLLIFHGLRARPRVDDLQAPRTVVALDRGLAIQGAVALAVAALVVGAAGSPLYGLLLGLGGAVGVALVVLRFHWLAERAPGWLPRGRTLGAAVALPFIVLMFVVAVLPIRAHRSAPHDNPGFATSLLQGARESLKSGDVKTAEDRVVQASFADPNNPDLPNVRDDLVVTRVQQLLDEQNRRQSVYDSAERAYRAGDRRRAIRLMASLKGFRDAQQRVAAFRAGR